MKYHSRKSKALEFVDPEFAEALEEGSSVHQSNSRQAERKARQFCRQVQRALNLAIADCLPADGANGLFVEDVLPAPDCGRLLVQVLVPPEQSAAEAMEVLRREAPRLRSEVANTITRKRAPELFFVPVSEGGGDE